MAHVTAGVEYGLHCLLYLVRPAGDADAPTASVRDLAELQGVPVEYLAKIFTKLQKAGIVAAAEGAGGGFRLARAPEAVRVLDVVTAIDGDKTLFDCREIRGRCALFAGNTPAWAIRGVCGIHAVMLEAEARMREALAARSLADIAAGLAAKAPPDFERTVTEWLATRSRSKPNPSEDGSIREEAR
jgi:Rrf2 family protein